MKKLLVRGDDQLIAALLGAFEEVPIANVRPPQLIGGIDCVSGQVSAEWNWGTLVEQDSQEPVGVARDSTS